MTTKCKEYKWPFNYIYQLDCQVHLFGIKWSLMLYNYLPTESSQVCLLFMSSILCKRKMEITIITNIFYCFMTLVILLIYMVALLVLISQKNPNRLGLRIFLKNLGIYAVCLCSVQSRLFVQCWPRIFLAQCQGNLCNVDAVFAATAYFSYAILHGASWATCTRFLLVECLS